MSTSNVVGYDGNSTQERAGRDGERRGEQGELLRAKRRQNQHHEQKLKQNTHLHPIPNFLIMSQSSLSVRVWLMAGCRGSCLMATVKRSAEGEEVRREKGA